MSNYAWGVSTLGCAELSLPEAVALAEKFQFPHLELRTLSNLLDLPAALQIPENAAEMQRLAADGRVRVLGTSFGITSDKGHEELAAYARVADQYGVPYLRVFGGFKFEDPLNDDHKRRAAENLRWFRQQNFKCKIAVETHDGLSSAARCCELFEAIGEPLPMVWDLHHTYCYGGESVAEAWDRIGKWTVDIHLKDSKPGPGGERIQTLPGEGNVPVTELFPLLDAAGYSGDVTLEHERKWHPELPPLPEALAAVNRLWRPTFFSR